MLSAAVYIRVSTDDQTEYSPEAQLKALKAYAKNNDMFIAPEHIYKDEGISGRKAEKRPAFMKMIATAKQKPRPFDVILVHKFDRFARNREDSIVYKTMLRKDCGIKVISITEHIEDDKFAIILESMLEAMAEYYSLNLADEVKKGMTEKALRGEIQTIAPYGYTKKKGEQMVIDPLQAKFIRYIYDEFLNDTPMVTIARNCTAMGMRTNRGNEIENRTVEYFLRNPVYAGYARWTPTGKTSRDFKNPDTLVVKSTHEPIIDEETFKKVQEKLDKQKALWKYKQRPATEYRHWLSGMIRCSACGCSLGIASTFLQCSNYSRGKCNTSHYLSKKNAINSVIQELERLIDLDSYEQISDYIEVRSKSNDEEMLLKKELEQVNKRLKKAKEAYLAEIDTLKEYGENKRKFTALKEDIEKKLKELKKDTFNPELFRQKIKETYNIITDDSKDDLTKNQALKEIVSKIVYHRSDNSFEYFLYF